MVSNSGTRSEGGTHIMSAEVRKTIQSIKEIVKHHSDAEIYVTLKETNMDADETAQKLLYQDPFHEVKRRKDKKKEVTVNKDSILSETRKYAEYVNHGRRFNTYSNHNLQRGGYSRNVLHDARVCTEFRVVRDNRANQHTKAPVARSPISTNEPVVSNIAGKSSSAARVSGNQKPPVARNSAQSSTATTDVHPRKPRDVDIRGRKDLLEDRQLVVPNASSGLQSLNLNDSQLNYTTASNNSVVGVYSSSSDPVHVPSLDSKPAANIGAFKREVGEVGARQSTENSVKLSSAQSSSFSNLHLGRDGLSRSFRSFNAFSKTDKHSQVSVHSSAMPGISMNRSFMNNQSNSRYHPSVGYQKASQPNKEWKPKSFQKQSSCGPGVIGTPAKSASHPTDTPKVLESEAPQLQDKLSRGYVPENQNVIIAAHIRVSETDRRQLTFGSLGTEFESSGRSGFQGTGGSEESYTEPSTSLSISAPESSNDGASVSKQVDLLDEHVRNSGTDSSASGAASEQQLTDEKESSTSQDMDTCTDIGLIHDNSPSYNPSELQQQQYPPQLPSFSAYDSQTGYDIPYFRPTVDETLRGHGLQSPQEALSSNTSNSILASTVAMLQQPPQMAQIYPQVHVSPFANLMPYRQFLSPVYVPPMAAYPHPSNGSSYLLMPGSSSHLTANGLKYGIQPFKPVPSGNPTGFGNFTNPTAYAINTPGVIGSATGVDDLSRLKYKDGNLYVPNPEAENSKIWMNPRDVPSLQSASYYNMTAQPPHAAYLPSHNGHSSFNAATQSSHMQFPGLYNPSPQPTGIPNPHHLGPAMGGNIGVGVTAATPGAQVGAYQQPQLGHMNWTGNF